jgi:DNA-binding LacI/PurR family transcriptional regulator
MEFISGIAEVLSPLSMSLVFQTVSSVEERLETYRTWAAAGKVAGVICTDLVKDDPALPVLKTLRLPAVVTTPCDDAASVWTDIPAAMHKVVRYLAGLGHVRIARVAGGGEYTHLKDRSVAFESEIAALGLAKPIVVTTDYSPEQGMSATRVLLSTVPRPTAIIYDNDVMAAAGLGMAIEMGLKVPQELSLVAWDDSLVTRLTYPPLTSVAYDIATFGAAVVRCLLDLIDGLVVTSTSLGEPHLTVRGTTGPLQLPGR